MRRYKFEVTIESGHDDFWDNLQTDGIEDVREMIVTPLLQSGALYDNDEAIRNVKLIEYVYRPGDK